jgi:hypothetical protein
VDVDDDVDGVVDDCVMMVENVRNEDVVIRKVIVWMSVCTVL